VNDSTPPGDADAMTRARRHSLIALAVLFAYYAIDRWLPLGAWNNAYGFPVDNDQAILDVIVLAVLAGTYAGVRAGWWPVMAIGVLLLGVWCYFHWTTWWAPYAFGVDTPGEIRWHEQFEAGLQLLPRAGDHIPPDAEHIGIDVCLVPATVLTLRALVTRLRQPRDRPSTRP
jgi:hypothetical protein